MRNKNINLTFVLSPAIVIAFARDGLYEKAEEFLEQLREAGLETYGYAYNN